MIYEYECQECKHQFSKSLLIGERDKPLSECCPSCQKDGTVTRVFNSLAVSYSGFKSPVTRAGSGWNDVLKKIKAGSGRHNTIQTN